MKNSFVLYCEYGEILKLLSDEEMGQLLRAIFTYESIQQIPTLTGAVAMAFSFIKKDLDENRQKYIEVCEKKKEAGRQGGFRSGATRKGIEVSALTEEANEADANFASKNEANEADNDNDLCLLINNKQDMRAREAIKKIEEDLKRIHSDFYQQCQATVKHKLLCKELFLVIASAQVQANTDDGLKFNKIVYNGPTMAKLLIDLDIVKLVKIINVLLDQDEAIENRPAYIFGTILNVLNNRGSG